MRRRQDEGTPEHPLKECSEEQRPCKDGNYSDVSCCKAFSKSVNLFRNFQRRPGTASKDIYSFLPTEVWAHHFSGPGQQKRDEI